MVAVAPGSDGEHLGGAVHPHDVAAVQTCGRRGHSGAGPAPEIQGLLVTRQVEGFHEPPVHRPTHAGHQHSADDSDHSPGMPERGLEAATAVVVSHKPRF
jgi:hypothetical protein